MDTTATAAATDIIRDRLVAAKVDRSPLEGNEATLAGYTAAEDTAALGRLWADLSQGAE